MMPPQVNGKPSYPERILCELAYIQRLVEGNMGSTNTIPLTNQNLFVDSREVVLTVPSSAVYCDIQIKGNGELRLAFNATPNSSNCFTFYNGDIIQLENINEMTSVHFLSTITNSLTIQYYCLS